jgi:glutathione reductase (NADPH)
MFTSMTGRPERVMMKLVVDHLTGKVLGVHMLGRDAAEIVQMAAIPVSMGATKADFDRAIAIHPTSAEELVTLKKPSYRLTKGKRL